MSILRYRQICLWSTFLCTLLVPLQASSQSGCTDPEACNFDSGAVTDDGSCLSDEVVLTFDNNICIDLPLHFQDLQENGLDTTILVDAATIDSGCYSICLPQGCYYVEAIGDPDLDFHIDVHGLSEGWVTSEWSAGGKTYFGVEAPICIPGCMDDQHCSYNPLATIPEECEDYCVGCGDSTACNYMPNVANAVDSLCVYPADIPRTCETAREVVCEGGGLTSVFGACNELVTDSLSEYWFKQYGSLDCVLGFYANSWQGVPCDVITYKGTCDNLIELSESVHPCIPFGVCEGPGAIVLPDPNETYYYRVRPRFNLRENVSVSACYQGFSLQLPELVEISEPSICNWDTAYHSGFSGYEEFKFYPESERVRIEAVSSEMDLQIDIFSLEGELLHSEDATLFGDGEVMEIWDLVPNEMYLLDIHGYFQTETGNYSFCISYMNCLPDDLNCDGAYNVEDLLEFLTVFSQSGPSDSDFNDDGLVNVDDLIYLLGLLDSGG